MRILFLFFFFFSYFLFTSVQQQTRPLVLLAEDNLVQTQLIKRVFERYHFEVLTACNGQMALDMYKANANFVLILMVN